MSIPIIDQLRPLGNFPAVDASDVQAGNERLSTVLSNTPSTAYVDSVVEDKVDKVEGKGLSTNDYTTEEKDKLSGIEAQANKTVVDSALSSSSENPVQNKVINTAISGKADAATVTTLAERVTQAETDINTQVARIDNIEKVNVYSESDFSKSGNTYVLMSNVIINNKIEITPDIEINLNGYTLKLSNSYTDESVFYFPDEMSALDKRKSIHGGVIDCNQKGAYVCFIEHITWNLQLSDLVINNSVKGLFGYGDLDGNTTHGAQFTVRNIVINHADVIDQNIGFDVQFGDSFIENVYPQFFKFGVRCLNGGNNSIKNVHPWGYPKTTGNDYSQGLIMKIGFIILASANNFIDCVSDTFEPDNVNSAASYSNGGIGFYIATARITMISSYAMTHNDTNNSNHIAFYYDNVDPVYQYDNRLARNCNIACRATYTAKTIDLYITPGKEYTLNNICCFYRLNGNSADSQNNAKIELLTSNLDGFTIDSIEKSSLIYKKGDRLDIDIRMKIYPTKSECKILNPFSLNAFEDNDDRLEQTFIPVYISPTSYWQRLKTISGFIAARIGSRAITFNINPDDSSEYTLDGSHSFFLVIKTSVNIL